MGMFTQTSNMRPHLKGSSFGDFDIFHIVESEKPSLHLQPLPNIAKKRYSRDWQLKLVSEAEDELLALPADMQARFIRIAELLVEFGSHRVGMPHIRHLDGKLWESRMDGRDGIARAVYVTRAGQTITVLHVFTKKTQKAPRKAMDIANQRLLRLNDE